MQKLRSQHSNRDNIWGRFNTAMVILRKLGYREQLNRLFDFGKGERRLFMPKRPFAYQPLRVIKWMKMIAYPRRIGQLCASEEKLYT